MILVLNGPPDCGKDTIADYLEEKYGFTHLRFKDGLYEAAIRASGVAGDFAMHLFTDRKQKEQITPYFRVGGNPVSPRIYLQHISEHMMKPLFGQGVFGKQLNLELEETQGNVVISDSGFDAELEEIIHHKGLFVIRIERPGRTFKEDTRKYLDHADFQINNQTTVEALLDDVNYLLKELEQYNE